LRPTKNLRNGCSEINASLWLIRDTCLAMTDQRYMLSYDSSEIHAYKTQKSNPLAKQLSLYQRSTITKD